MNNKEKYLLITKFDTIEERCSGCSIAGINLQYFKNNADCVRKLAEVSNYANVKVIGGRYGIGGKEFTPAMVKSVFDNLEENMKKFTRTAIMDWLYENGYLAKDEDGNKYITEKGMNAGIYYDHRVSSNGREYDVITYPVSLLNTILDLMESGEIA